MRVTIMTSEQAAAIRAMTTGIYAVDPRPITGGPHAGGEAVPETLGSDPRYAAFVAMLDDLPVVDLDVATAWPVADEDG